MKKSLFLCLFFIIITEAKAELAIQKSIANLHEKPDANSPLVSQASYGSPINILQKEGGFAKIKTDDNYEGWVKLSDLGNLTMASSVKTVRVDSIFAYAYKEPDDTLHPPLALLPYGTKLPIAKIQDTRWIQIHLVGGTKGWIQQGDIVIDAKPFTMQEMLAKSSKFVNLPYLWAGTSVFGFDCSGFVQFLYRQIGIIIPRDANLQVIWPRFIEVKKGEFQPGDIIYFGWDNVISHAAIYLGDNKFINSTVHNKPIVQINDLREDHWKKIYITARRLDPHWPNQPEFQSSIEPIPENIEAKMRKFTWREACPVPITDLAYLKLSHYGFDGKTHTGNLIVHKKLASEVVSIFKDLYKARFPIEKIRPIEEYQGNDDLSMQDNNTSAFNCRSKTDFPNEYSLHSYGTAIDINPLQNPYINGEKAIPQGKENYTNRKAHFKGKISTVSAPYKAFTKMGWKWGGDWPEKNYKDYQHFEK